ncbi:MAG: hypothetical protein NZM04_08380 [Methylacidiphilales bacterium]|nr:hypothetical protein [Candidatus Methylacidiphilales bacterium]MDW8349883.1 hypothetical protein [Verrucomicrobiae bacterium]
MRNDDKSVLLSQLLRGRDRLPDGVDLENFCVRFDRALRERMIRRHSLRMELRDRIMGLFNFNPMLRLRYLGAGVAVLVLVFGVYFGVGWRWGEEVELALSKSLSLPAQNVRYVGGDEVFVGTHQNDEAYNELILKNKGVRATVRYVSADEPYLADSAMTF